MGAIGHSRSRRSRCRAICSGAFFRGSTGFDRSDRRPKVILIGIVAATVLRIAFAGVTTQLLQIIGFLFAGGILLLGVCWKMWREQRTPHSVEAVAVDCLDFEVHANGIVATGGSHKTFAQVALQSVVAGVSMSLDNVLAVAGATRDHPYVLIFGLAFRWR